MFLVFRLKFQVFYSLQLSTFPIQSDKIKGAQIIPF